MITCPKHLPSQHSQARHTRGKQNVILSYVPTKCCLLRWQHDIMLFLLTYDIKHSTDKIESETYRNFLFTIKNINVCQHCIVQVSFSPNSTQRTLTEASGHMWRMWHVEVECSGNVLCQGYQVLAWLRLDTLDTLWIAISRILELSDTDIWYNMILGHSSLRPHSLVCQDIHTATYQRWLDLIVSWKLDLMTLLTFLV